MTPVQLLINGERCGNCKHWYCQCADREPDGENAQLDGQEHGTWPDC
jgi:hypothetical protein